jgi:phytanoyl-CoA hydroxylase
MMVFNFLRRFKYSFEVYNFFHKKSLNYQLPLYKKQGLKKKYYSSVSSADFAHLPQEKNTHDLRNSAEKLPQNEVFKTLNNDLKTSLLHWSDNGYAVLNNFFSPDKIDAVNKEIDRLVDDNKANYRNNKTKIMFAIHQSETIKAIGENKQLVDILTMLMDKPVDLFQSINFRTGSQQRSHSDSIHMTTYPFGNIIACWVALEDITADSGPLHYYPSSHKLPYIMNKDFDNEGNRWTFGNKDYGDYENRIAAELSKHSLEKQVFLAKKGDVFIWHANLLHGGEPVANSNSSRKSMVLHYYTRDAICYHEITQRPTLKKTM